MGYVYRVAFSYKSHVNILSEAINILRKLHTFKDKIFGMPRKIYHRVMYIVPSRGLILLNMLLPFSDVWLE